jgi:hypothetical protein
MTALLPDDEPAGVEPSRDRRRLGDVLVDAEVITEAELAAALDAQRTVIGSRRRLGHVLVDLAWSPSGRSPRRWPTSCGSRWST